MTKKFMAVFTAPREEIDAFMSKSEDEREMETREDVEKWTEWSVLHESELEDEGGMFGRTKRITPEGVLDAKNDLTGYAIVEADNYDEAVQAFQKHPYLNFPGAAIDVMERIDLEVEES